MLKEMGNHWEVFNRERTQSGLCIIKRLPWWLGREWTTGTTVVSPQDGPSIPLFKYIQPAPSYPRVLHLWIQLTSDHIAPGRWRAILCTRFEHLQILEWGGGTGSRILRVDCTHALCGPLPPWGGLTHVNHGMFWRWWCVTSKAGS